MSIVNQSFFINELNLPNTGNEKVLDKLQSAIDRYEPEFLRKVMGGVLYTEFAVTPRSQRMAEILSGVNYYDVNGVLQNYKGLVYDTNRSPIANYVYYCLQENTAKITTGVATATMKVEAGRAESPADKMITAWNLMSNDVVELINFLWLRKDVIGVRVYPEFNNAYFWQVRQEFKRNNFLGF